MVETNKWYYAIGNDFKGWALKEYAWLVIAVGIVIAASLGGSGLELLASVTNVVCVLLVAKGRVSNYYWGVIGVISYSILAYQQNLYGNMSLNVIYVGFQVWGIIEWRRSLLSEIHTKHQEVSVKTLSLTHVIYLVVSLLITSFVVGYGLSRMGGYEPYLDAFTLLASLTAMYLMVKRISFQWVLWIAVNIASIYMWVVPAIQEQGSWAMPAMWSVFLINSLYGAYKWFIVKDNK